MKAMRLLFVAFVVLGLGGCFFFNGDTTTATLEVVNNSADPIVFFYISPHASYLWGVDQLGSSTIQIGFSHTFTGITPGIYDLQARDVTNDPLFGVIKEILIPGISFAAGDNVVWIVD